MKYYKVVKEERGKYYSVLKNRLGHFSVEYKLNKWVFPCKGTNALYVFKNYTSAYTFAQSSEYIFECKVRNPRHIKYLACLYSIPEFWIKKKHHKKQDSIIIAPGGTCAVNAVKLIKRII